MNEIAVEHVETESQLLTSLTSLSWIFSPERLDPGVIGPVRMISLPWTRIVINFIFWDAVVPNAKNANLPSWTVLWSIHCWSLPRHARALVIDPCRSRCFSPNTRHTSADGQV